MIVEYQIVSDVNRFRLHQLANMLIKQGWQPLGGLSIAHTDISDDVEEGQKPVGLVYMQAMGR